MKSINRLVSTPLVLSSFSLGLGAVDAAHLNVPRSEISTDPTLMFYKKNTFDTSGILWSDA